MKEEKFYHKPLFILFVLTIFLILVAAFIYYDVVILSKQLEQEVLRTLTYEH